MEFLTQVTSERRKVGNGVCKHKVTGKRLKMGNEVCKQKVTGESTKERWGTGCVTQGYR